MANYYSRYVDMPPEGVDTETPEQIYRYGARVDTPSQPARFPPPSRFYGADPFREPELFARAPWMDPVHVLDDELILEYVHGNMLPGRLPYKTILSRDWINRCALPKELLVIKPGEDRVRKHVEFARRVYQTLRRRPNTTPIPASFGLDIATYRTRGEIEYVDRLMNLSVDQLRSWEGVFDVLNDALLFGRKPQMPYEFRYLRKRDCSSWEDARWERRARSRLGHLVPYQMVEAYLIILRHLVDRYVGLPLRGWEIEACRGCNVENPLCLSYIGSALIPDRLTGFWVVVYTEVTAKTAVFILWDVYDTYRLWYIPPRMRQWLRKLDLSTVLGSRNNHDELLRLLDVVDKIDWENPNVVPVANRQRDNFRNDKARGRTSNAAGDFVHYNPGTCEIIDASAAKDLRDDPFDLPAGHPTGYVFEPLWEGEQNHDREPGEDLYIEEGENRGESRPASTGMVLDLNFDNAPARALTNADTTAPPTSTAAAGTRPRPVETGYDSLVAVQTFLREAGLSNADLPQDWEELREAVRRRLNPSGPSTGGSGPSNAAATLTGTSSGQADAPMEPSPSSDGQTAAAAASGAASAARDGTPGEAWQPDTPASS